MFFDSLCARYAQCRILCARVLGDCVRGVGGHIGARAWLVAGVIEWVNSAGTIG